MAVSFVELGAEEIQTLTGVARGIADDFAAKGIDRLDQVTASVKSNVVTITVKARARDKTQHSLTYWGPTTSGAGM